MTDGNALARVPISLPRRWGKPGRSASRRCPTRRARAGVVLEQLSPAAAHRHALPTRRSTGYRQGSANTQSDSIPPERFIGPAFVIDCSKQAAKDSASADQALPSRLGKSAMSAFAPRSWVLMRPTGRRKAPTRSPTRTTTRPASHTPGTRHRCRTLSRRRTRQSSLRHRIDVGTDAGQAIPAAGLPLPLLHARAGRYGLQCLARISNPAASTGAIVRSPRRSDRNAAAARPRTALMESK